MKEQQVVFVTIGGLCANVRPRVFVVQTTYPDGRTHQLRHRSERDVGGVGFAERGKHVHPSALRKAHDLMDQPSLTDTGRSREIHHTAATAQRTVKQSRDGAEFQVPSHQSRRRGSASSPCNAMLSRRRAGTGFVRTLDLHPLRLAESGHSADTGRGSLSITSPGEATDSIRCAIPTCSPTAV